VVEFRVANTAFGAVSFLALEAIGATIALNYGFRQRALGDPRRRADHLSDRPADQLLRGAARRGHGPADPRRRLRLPRLDPDLAGLRGLHVHLLCARAAIMALALQMVLDVPLVWCYALSAVVVIPLVTHGITLISRLQLWTQPSGWCCSRCRSWRWPSATRRPTRCSRACAAASRAAVRSTR